MSAFQRNSQSTKADDTDDFMMVPWDDNVGYWLDSFVELGMGVSISRLHWMSYGLFHWITPQCIVILLLIGAPMPIVQTQNCCGWPEAQLMI